MNDEYIWDKKGSDAEIERLEGLLSGFQYKSAAAPRVPVVSEDRSWGFWPRLSLGFAGAGAFAAIVAAVFFFRVGEPANIVVQTPSTAVIEPNAAAENILPPSVEEKQPIETPAPVTTVYRPKEPTRNAPPLRASTRPRSKRIKISPDALTAEERYAYEQLKIALAITGTKLKAVSDTVNGTED